MVKNPPTMEETWVRILGWEDSPREGHGNPLQYSCLENPMDREAWQVTIHGVSKSQMQLSTAHSTNLGPVGSPSEEIYESDRGSNLTFYSG